MVRPHHVPSAALVLIATGNNVVQDVTGFSGFGIKKFLDAEDPQLYCDEVFWGRKSEYFLKISDLFPQNLLKQSSLRNLDWNPLLSF